MHVWRCRPCSRSPGSAPWWLHDALAPLLPEGALQRGRAIGCVGRCAPSLAVALTTRAVAAGSWAAAVDLPSLGLDAATELGLPLERFVRIDTGTRRSDPAGWAEVVAAALDGFELVLVAPPARVPDGVLRRVLTRVQHRGAVLITVGAAGVVPVELTVRASRPDWIGAGTGHGHLLARRLRVEASGRRLPRPRRVEVWLPAPDGGLVPAAADDTAEHPPIDLRSVS